jgi:hypothetical protein
MSAPSSHSRVLSHLAALLCGVTLIPLLIWDATPKLLPSGAHAIVAATPLALAAVACLTLPIVRRAGLPELVKASLLATAFLFWAANQLWPDHPLSTLFNDIAVVFFVIDVLLATMGWPASEARERLTQPSRE